MAAALLALSGVPSGGRTAIARDRAFVVPPYTIVDLGTLGGQRAAPAAVSVSGAVVGYSETSAGANHATLWAPNGEIIDLKPTGGDSFATSINANGMIGGRLLTGGETQYGAPFEHAVVWSHGDLTDLTPGESFAEAYDLNDLGTVTGYLKHSESDAAFAMVGHVGHPNQLLSTRYSSGSAINDRGTTAGALVLGLGAAAENHAALWANGRETDLGTLPGFSSSFGSGIDIENRVAGFAVRADGAMHAFLWRDGRMVDLSTPAGTTGAEPSAMTNSDQMIGFSWASPGIALPGGWIWRDGTFEAIDRLLPPRTSWTELTPRGINDLGQIVGTGRRDGISRPFLLSPPPQTMAGNFLEVVHALDVRSASFRRDADYLLERVPTLIAPGSACAWLEGFSTYATKTKALDPPERIVLSADIAGLEYQALKCGTAGARTAPMLIIDAFSRRAETRAFSVRTRRPTRLTISVATPTNSAARLTIRGLSGRIATHGRTTTLVTTRRISKARFTVRATRLARTTPVVVRVR